jgi:hypothetical protein
VPAQALAHQLRSGLASRPPQVRLGPPCSYCLLIVQRQTPQFLASLCGALSMHGHCRPFHCYIQCTSPRFQLVAKFPTRLPG